jgi:hypothetical protein
MDFVTDLPVCCGYDAVWTVTDRLTKAVHFIPVRKDMSSEELSHLFLREVASDCTGCRAASSPTGMAGSYRLSGRPSWRAWVRP